MSFSVVRSMAMFCLVSLLVLPKSFAQVQLNEVFADNRTNRFADGSISDWVELYNNAAEAVNLSGYSLTDATDTPRKWVFPAGVTILPGGYLVVLLDSSRAPSTGAGTILNTGFGIKAMGDRIECYSPANLLVESVRFGPQVANCTIGKIPAGTGNFVLTIPSPGSANVPQSLGPSETLRINEWMASPSTGSDWFEIYNPGSLPVQLTGLHFTDNGNEPSPVAPLSFIGAGLDGFLQIFADNSTNDNEVDFGLGAGGDSIGLYSTSGSQIDRVVFGQQTANVSQGRLPDGTETIRSLNVPTPAESNLILYDGLMVNELLSHTDPPVEDAVEFYNRTDADINIGGWFLSNSRNDLKRYRVPDETVVRARAYWVIYEGQFNGAAAQTPFTFNAAHGDQVYLSQAVNGDLTGFIVHESFEAAENRVSFGRVETSVPNDHKFVAMSRTTFGADNPSSVEEFRTGTGLENSGSRVGPIVINEIMYNPLSLDGLSDNTEDEYIELVNITSQDVALFDPAHPENRWLLQGAAAFTFPASSMSLASGTALLVSFDPADEARLAAFRTKFSIGENVPIYGPYNGKLGNGGDEVEIYKPDPPQGPQHPDAGFVPYIRVDKVNYSDAAPWPTMADGTGKSLQRENSFTFGNDPINWDAADPTAGRANSAQVTDTDGDGMPDLWEQQYGFDPDSSADASADADGDTLSNVQEYIAGTHPRDSASALRVGAISLQGTNSPAMIEVSVVPGRSYSIQFRNNLQPSTVWETLVTTNAAGSTVTFQDNDAHGRSQSYYRVVTPSAD